jgi:ATP-dependent protease HslVU (ClpYQ) peptidase subunit
MIEFFAERVRELFKARGITQMFNDTEERFNSAFLIGFRGQLFTMQEDFSVIDWSSNIHAIGVGEEFALGSLITSQKLVKSPIKRIELALTAAAQFCPMVIPPFTILTTAKRKV